MQGRPVVHAQVQLRLSGASMMGTGKSLFLLACCALAGFAQAQNDMLKLNCAAVRTLLSCKQARSYGAMRVL